MKVTDNRPVSSYSNIKKKAKSAASGSSFADIMAASTASSGSTAESSGVAATAPMDGLLALQEVSEEDYARRETLKQGHNLIQSLEALRQSLLLGAVPYSVLRTLEGRLSEQRQMTVDPDLHSIMDDIELRAAVELAKLEANSHR